MAFSLQEKRFFDAAQISAVIATTTDPIAQNVDGEQIVANILAQEKFRDVVFFDEQLKVLAIFQVPYCSEEDLKSYLKRLYLKVDAWTVANEESERSQAGNSSSTRELIGSQVVQQVEDPITLVKQHDETEGGGLFFQLVWVVDVMISRPRSRFQDPSVFILPTATISPKVQSDPSKGYLPLYSTQDLNLLQPLQPTQGLFEIPYLPAFRLERVLPALPVEDNRFRIHQIPSILTKVYPGVIARMKYTRVNHHTLTPTAIASLEVEIIPFISIRGSIQKVDMSLANGKVDPLMKTLIPMECKSKDGINFLFNLQSSLDGDGSQNTTQTSSLTHSNVDIVTISLEIKLYISQSCAPIIQMEWNTNVDFSQALNPLYGPPSQIIQRNRRPASLPFGAENTITPSSTTSISLQPVGKDGQEAAYTISFSVPESPVVVGQPFSWRVLVINKLSRPIRLAIVPLPRIHRVVSQAQNLARHHAPNTSIGSAASTDRHNSKISNHKDVAQATLDENIVYAMQHSGSVLPETDVVSLTAELRVGPLGPGQCHETEIKMVAFKAGAFTLDAIRIVDLNREFEDAGGAPSITDIRELPDIIVLEGEE